MTPSLTSENYKQGFLVDDDLMAGVTPHPEQPGVFVAFVLQHTTGEYLGYQPFNDLDSALRIINQIQRSWNFEAVGGCGGCGEGGMCSKGGGCKAGACGKTEEEPCPKGN
jgi:hypothetical protein